MGRLRVGCAGWAYDEWVGPVYPHRLPAHRRLRAYATRFDLVEIDSTFYAVPAPAVVAAWLGQVADHPDFRFTAKLPQAVTHDALPGGRLQTVEDILNEFLDVVVEPLEAAGRLECVLVQLPPRFQATSPAEKASMLERMASVLAKMGAPGRHVAVEFRNRCWFEADGSLEPQARKTMESLKAGLVRVDGLGLRLTPTRTTPWSYFRLHGRDANFPSRGPGGPGAPQKGPYAPEEIRELAFSVRASLGEDSSTLVIFTYHQAGQSALHAVALLEGLGQRALGLPIPPFGARSLEEFS